MPVIPTRALLGILARGLPMPVISPRFIQSSTQELRSRLHSGFPMVAGAARKPRIELFSPPDGLLAPAPLQKSPALRLP